MSSLFQTLTFSRRTSCLLSPLTYEGLLDETFGISCGTVEFPPEVTKTETATKLQLSCKDKMFDKIRNKHFASIFSVLGVTAKQLSAAQAAAGNMSVSQMKQFVANDLRVMKAQSKAVALHISASEAIQREKGGHFEGQLPVEHALVSGSNYKENICYIEDCMALLKPLTIPLRLICLLSHCSDGLALSDYQKLKTQFIQAYGFSHLVTWNNLLKLGVIRVRGGISNSSSLTSLKPAEAANVAVNKMSQMAGLVGAGQGAARGGTFQQLVKKLGCVPAPGHETSLSEPSSAGYVFNGAYTPLACRLVEEVLRCDGNLAASPAQEAVKMLPGEATLQWAGNTGNKVSLFLTWSFNMTSICAAGGAGALRGRLHHGRGGGLQVAADGDGPPVRDRRHQPRQRQQDPGGHGEAVISRVIFRPLDACNCMYYTIELLSIKFTISSLNQILFTSKSIYLLFVV